VAIGAEDNHPRRRVSVLDTEISFVDTGEGVDGEPADVVATANDYGACLGRSPIPKLLIAGDPGAMLVGPARDFCDSWPRQQKVTVPGIYYLQEDPPTEIGVAIARFIKDLPE